MKNQSTAEKYSRGLRALFPKGFDWKEAGLQSDKEPLDELALSEQMQGWKAFLSVNL